MSRIASTLLTGVVALMMAVGMALPAQADYRSGSNCASQYYTHLHTNTYSELTHRHTYYPTSGTGVYWEKKTLHDLKMKSPYVTGRWSATNKTAYEAFEIFQRTCVPRPVLAP